MELIPGVYQVPGVIANTYVIVEAEGVTLIDSGLARRPRRIVTYLRELGRSPRDVIRILITHADGDHVGGLHALLQSSAAIAATSRSEAEALARGRMSRPLKVRGIMKWLLALSRPFFRVSPVEVDRVLEPGESLPVLGELQVLSTPGHTPGHLSFFAPAQRILFAGDSMRSNKAGLTPSRGANTWDEDLAVESMRQQAALAPYIVGVGHGPVVRDAESRFLLP